VCGLHDGQGVFQVCTGGMVVAEVIEGAAEVGQGPGGLRMVGSVGGFRDGQGTFEVIAGGGVVPPPVQRDPESVEGLRDVRVLRTVCGLVDVEGAPQRRDRRIWV